MKIENGQVYKYKYFGEDRLAYFRVTGIGPRTIYIKDLDGKRNHRFSKTQFEIDFELSEVHNSPLWKVLNE